MDYLGPSPIYTCAPIATKTKRGGGGGYYKSPQAIHQMITNKAHSHIRRVPQDAFSLEKPQREPGSAPQRTIDRTAVSPRRPWGLEQGDSLMELLDLNTHTRTWKYCIFAYSMRQHSNHRQHLPGGNSGYLVNELSRGAGEGSSNSVAEALRIC